MIDDFIQPGTGSRPFTPLSDSISIVGSSGKLLFHPKPQEIDGAGDVCRFNFAPTEGFEEYVGKKTTIHLLNINFLYTHINTEYALHMKHRFPDFKPHGLKTLESSKIVFKFSKEYAKNARLPTEQISQELREKGNEVYFLTEGSQNFFRNEIGRDPSCGFFGIMIGLSYYKHVRLYGFSDGNDQYPRHYYREMGSYKPGGHHDFDRETSLRKKMAEAGLFSVN